MYYGRPMPRLPLWVGPVPGPGGPRAAHHRGSAGRTVPRVRGPTAPQATDPLRRPNGTNGPRPLDPFAQPNPSSGALSPPPPPPPAHELRHTGARSHRVTNLSPSVVSIRGPGPSPVHPSPARCGVHLLSKVRRAAVLTPPFLLLHRRRVGGGQGIEGSMRHSPSPSPPDRGCGPRTAGPRWRSRHCPPPPK